MAFRVSLYGEGIRLLAIFNRASANAGANKANHSLSSALINAKSLNIIFANLEYT